MVEKLWFLIPEMVLFAGVVATFIIGLSRDRRMRDALPMVTCVFLAAAFAITPWVYGGEHGQRLLSQNPNIMLMPMLGRYV